MFSLPGSWQRGVALPELLVGIFVLATLITGIVGLATVGTRTAILSEQRVIAQAIANEEAEIIRAHLYQDVGFADGTCAPTDADACSKVGVCTWDGDSCALDSDYAAGILPRFKEVTRNGQVYTVVFTYKLITDDPNGQLRSLLLPAHAQGPSAEEVDYKQVDIAVARGPKNETGNQTITTQSTTIVVPRPQGCTTSADCNTEWVGDYMACCPADPNNPESPTECQQSTKYSATGGYLPTADGCNVVWGYSSRPEPVSEPEIDPSVNYGSPGEADKPLCQLPTVGACLFGKRLLTWEEAVQVLVPHPDNPAAETTEWQCKVFTRMVDCPVAWCDRDGNGATDCGVEGTRDTGVQGSTDSGAAGCLQPKDPLNPDAGAAPVFVPPNALCSQCQPPETWESCSPADLCVGGPLVGGPGQNPAPLRPACCYQFDKGAVHDPQLEGNCNTAVTRPCRAAGEACQERNHDGSLGGWGRCVKKVRHDGGLQQCEFYECIPGDPPLCHDIENALNNGGYDPWEPVPITVEPEGPESDFFNRLFDLLSAYTSQSFHTGPYALASMGEDHYGESCTTHTFDFSGGTPVAAGNFIEVTATPASPFVSDYFIALARTDGFNMVFERFTLDNNEDPLLKDFDAGRLVESGTGSLQYRLESADLTDGLLVHVCAPETELFPLAADNTKTQWPPPNSSYTLRAELVPEGSQEDTLAPDPPGNFQGTPHPTQPRIDLTWNVPNDLGGGSVVGYHLYRNGVEIPVIITGTTYADTNLASGVCYNYGVSAYDNAQPEANGSPLALLPNVCTASVLPPSSPQPSPSSTVVPTPPPPSPQSSPGSSPAPTP
jgi:type II secretory pathway pseudopilin PulG